MAITDKEKTTKTTKKVDKLITETSVEPTATNDSEVIMQKINEKDAEIAELKNMILQMQSMVMANNTSNSQPTPTTQEDYIPVYKYIPVVSLYEGTLNLSVEPMGKGKTYTFSKFGDMRNIVYTDLRDIVSNNFEFSNNGYFYIMDKKAVEEIGLSSVYENFVTAETIMNIMEENKDTIADIFTSAPVAQREAIVNYLVTKMSEGVEYDLNKIRVIGNLYGKDLEDMVKDLKFVMDDKNKK